MTALRLVRDDADEAVERDTRKKMELGKVYALTNVISSDATTFSYLLLNGGVVSVSLPTELADDESIKDAMWGLAWAADASCAARMEVVK